MPRFREHVSEVQVVGPPGGRNATAADFGTNVTSAVDDAGNAVVKSANAVRDAAAQYEVSDLHAKMSDLYAQSTADLQQSLQTADPNDREFASRFRQKVEDNLAKVAGDATSPEARNYVIRAGGQIRAHFMEQAMAGQVQLAGQKAVNDVTTSYDKLTNSLFQNPASFDMALGLNNEGIDALVQSGRLPPVEGMKLKQRFSAGLAESAVRGWIALNPEDAKNQINSGKWDEYISGDQKHQLLLEGDQAIRARHVQDELAKKAEHEALKLKQMDTQNSFLADFASGKLTTKQVLASNLDPFGSGSKEQFIQMLKAQAKEGSGSIKNDPSTMINLFGQIQSGNIRDENDLNQYFGKGLNEQSLGWLRGEIQGRRTTEGKIEGQLKDGLINVAKSAMVKSDSMTGFKDDKGEELLQSWMSWFLPEYDKQRKAGKTANELLSPDSPDYLGKTIPQYKRSPIEIMRDKTASLGANPGSLSTAGAAPPTPAPPPGYEVK